MAVVQWLKKILENNTVFKVCPAHSNIRVMYVPGKNICGNCQRIPNDHFCQIYTLQLRVSSYGRVVYRNLTEGHVGDTLTWDIAPVLLCIPCRSLIQSMINEDAQISHYLDSFNFSEAEEEEEHKYVNDIIGSYLYSAQLKCPFH